MVRDRARKKQPTTGEIVAVVRGVVAILAVLVLPAGAVIRGDDAGRECVRPATGAMQ